MRDQSRRRSRDTSRVVAWTSNRDRGLPVGGYGLWFGLKFWGSHNLQAFSQGPHSRFQLGCRSCPITCNHVFWAYVEEESICSRVADLDVHVSPTAK
jgi:hypothetical protein